MKELAFILIMIMFGSTYILGYNNGFRDAKKGGFR